MFQRTNKSQFLKQASKIDESVIEQQTESGEIPLNNTDFYNEDNKLTGIISSSNTTRKTMPDFIEKLAEQEKDNVNRYGEELKNFHPENIEFDQENGISRAGELTSDESRVVESKTKEISDDDIKLEFEKLLAEGATEDELLEKLRTKYPISKIKQFVEASKKDFILKQSQLGHIYIDKNSYITCEEMRSHLATLQQKGRRFISKIKANLSEKSGKKTACNNCIKLKKGFCLLTNLKVEENPTITTDKEANLVINNIKKIAFVDPDVVDEYVNKCGNSEPADILGTVIHSLEDIMMRSAKKDFNSKVAFKREADELDNSTRETSNERNERKTAKINDDVNEQRIFDYFKKYIQAGMSKKQATIELSKKFNATNVEGFYTKFASDINKFEAFFNRKSNIDCVDRVENETTTRDLELEIDEAIDSIKLDAMKALAYNMLISGYSLDEVKQQLKKLYTTNEVKVFMNLNENKLENEYGQLGYNYIDSGIYENCDMMKKAYENIPDFRKQLLFNIKANKKCAGCSLHIAGRCNKVGLMLSNGPSIRSSRSAQKHLKRASKFLPANYIKEFEGLLNSTDNRKIISKFNLGAKVAYDTNGIKKVANKQIDNTVYNTFEKTESYDTDIFTVKSKSSIIDSVLGNE